MPTSERMGVDQNGNRDGEYRSTLACRLLELLRRRRSGAEERLGVSEYGSAAARCFRGLYQRAEN